MINCKCGNNMFYLVRKKAKNKDWYHNGIYCTVCGKWVKWVNDKDLTQLKILNRIDPEFTSAEDWAFIDRLHLDYFNKEMGHDG